MKNQKYDREVVEFYLRSEYLHSNRNPDFHVVLRQAFGEDICLGRGRYDWPERVLIRCTLEQFARFLIYRNNANIANSFKELDATIVAETQCVFDMTGN